MTHPRSRLPLRRLALLATALLGFMGLTGLMAGAPVIAQRRPMQTSGPSIADVQRRAASLNPGLQTQVSTASAGVEWWVYPRVALTLVGRGAVSLTIPRFHVDPSQREILRAMPAAFWGLVGVTIRAF